MSSNLPLRLVAEFVVKVTPIMAATVNWTRKERRAARASAVAIKRCTTVWSPPLVQIYQVSIDRIRPTTLMRVAGSTPKNGW